MESLIFIEGTWYTNGLIPISDPGFLFGEGVFRTIRVVDGAANLWPEQWERFCSDCKALSLPVPPLQERVEHFLDNRRGWWRLKLIATPNLGAMTIEPYQPPPTTPVTLKITPHIVVGRFSGVKTLAYLEHLQVKREAHLRGVDDLIVCSSEGFLCETGIFNLFWTHQGTTYTPDLSLPLLPGVMLSSLMDESWVQVKVKRVPEGAKLYVCNALQGVRPAQIIGEIDARGIH